MIFIAILIAILLLILVLANETARGMLFSFIALVIGLSLLAIVGIILLIVFIALTN